MKNKKFPAFSLAELMVYLAIVCVLALLIIPSFTGKSEKSRRIAATHDIEVGLAAALDEYESDNGRYPTTEQGLIALYDKPKTKPIPRNWQGPYVKKKNFQDPWGIDYQYRSPGIHNKHSYDLSTFANDGAEGGDGVDKDIVNWE